MNVPVVLKTVLHVFHVFDSVKWKIMIVEAVLVVLIVECLLFVMLLPKFRSCVLFSNATIITREDNSDHNKFYPLPQNLLHCLLWLRLQLYNHHSPLNT